MPSVVLDEHLAGCQECSAWLDVATRAGRLLRVSGTTPPDLSEQILRHAALPAARVLRRRRALQLGLVLAAAVQWALAVPGLWGENIGMAAAMGMGAHQAHESAAWNVAVGAALLAVALRPARAAGTAADPAGLRGGAGGAQRAGPAGRRGHRPPGWAAMPGWCWGCCWWPALARAERVPAPGPAGGPRRRAHPARSLPRRHRGAA